MEDALPGERLRADTIEDVAALAGDDVDPLDDARGSATYKCEMARVWVSRALRDLLDGPTARANTDGRL